jgi:hypothetical protein
MIEVKSYESMATTLSMVIMQRSVQAGMEYSTHDVLHTYLEGAAWPEERKADLYARIVESYKFKMKFNDFRDMVRDKIIENLDWWCTRG